MDVEMRGEVLSRLSGDTREVMRRKRAHSGPVNIEARICPRRITDSDLTAMF